LQYRGADKRNKTRARRAITVEDVSAEDEDDEEWSAGNSNGKSVKKRQVRQFWQRTPADIGYFCTVTHMRAQKPRAAKTKRTKRMRVEPDAQAPPEAPEDDEEDFSDGNDDGPDMPPDDGPDSASGVGGTDQTPPTVKRTRMRLVPAEREDSPVADEARSGDDAVDNTARCRSSSSSTSLIISVMIVSTKY
jgi:hypothetical protein